MADESTTQRRDLLLTLLSRFERGVITDRERPLLRPLVEAEMATLDQLDAAQVVTEGLRDAIAQALEDADYRQDMRRGDLADAVMPVVLRRIGQLATPAVSR